MSAWVSEFFSTSQMIGFDPQSFYPDVVTRAAMYQLRGSRNLGTHDDDGFFNVRDLTKWPFFDLKLASSKFLIKGTNFGHQFQIFITIFFY